MTWGFFKKLVIADKVALYVTIVYNHPAEYHFLNVIIAILLFSVQVYCDFSGYTDIARGAARTMGYELMINFNRPLFSKNVPEYWNRCHISLSTWLKDYLFYPIAVEKRNWGKGAIIFATAVTFIVSGIWHGAGWNFLIWGALHAVFVIVTILLFRKKTKGKNIGGLLLTIFLVAYAFVFFRSVSVAQATSIIRASVHFASQVPFTFGISSFYKETGIGVISMGVLLFYIIFMLFYEYKTDPSLLKMNRLVFWDILWFVFVTVSIVFFGVFTKQTFIYFQF